MLDKTEVIESPPQLTAVIHLTVPASEIMKVMGAGIGEVREKVTAQGLKAGGACSPITSRSRTVLLISKWAWSCPRK